MMYMSPYAYPGIKSPQKQTAIEIMAEWIDYVVCDIYGLKIERLYMSCRKYAEPRQVAMYLLRKINGSSYHAIGNHYGCDHSTVIHACKVVPNFIQTDKIFMKRMTNIYLKLNING